MDMTGKAGRMHHLELAMSTITATAATAARPWTYWLGWVLSGILILFFLVDGAIKLVPLDAVTTTLTELGYPTEHARLIGIITLGSIILYAIPRTAVLGAILLTGLFAAAMSTHLRVGSPLFTHTLFGLYMGVWAWAGLWLRDPRVRALLPLRR